MASYDTKDDVDRLFACFKCGLSTPESALREGKSGRKKLKRESIGKEGQSSGPSKLSVSNDKPVGSTSMEKKLSWKKISPLIFYGSPIGHPRKRASRLLRLLHEIHVDLREQNELIPRSEVWTTFPKQEEAMRFAKTHGQVSLFCYQDHLSGQRRFLVSTYGEFWRRYMVMDSKFRHHYEVIQEGQPCHLYFDLEFEKGINPGRDVDEMVDILISVTFNMFYSKYSIEGNREWIVELDSSTEGKFSRHLIIRIPKTAFKDNSHAGAFVSEVCKFILTDSGRNNPQLCKLFVKKDLCSPEPPDHLFLDSAVYSRNRCFRLALSSKAGKTSFLIPTVRFKCKNLSQRQMFMESLICNMEMDCSKLLICKMDFDCKKCLCFDSEVHQANYKISTSVTFERSGNNFPSTSYGRSPFLALDLFLESIASIGNISGRIQSWYWFTVEGLMIYNMSRGRYCERIGREHKSNHIMFIVDFQRLGYYQKCHDPDCKGYRSPLRPLPEDVVSNIVAVLESTDMDDYRVLLNHGTNVNLDERNTMHPSFYDEDTITDTCTKDNHWWHEVIKYSNCIENMTVASETGELNKGIVEDSSWWLDAERVLTQLEEHADG